MIIIKTYLLVPITCFKSDNSLVSDNSLIDSQSDNSLSHYLEW